MQAVLKRKVISQQPQVVRGFFILVLLVFVVAVAFGISLLNKHHLTPGVLNDLIRGQTTHLKQTDGRVNILLLGNGGAGHEGGDLTDTVMVASIALATHQIVFVALPRDIYIPELKDRINAAYSQGEAKMPGGGFILAKSIAEEVTGLPIHYGVLIDFSGFKKLIDTAGGVDVDIAESFTDKQFPITGKENDLCGGDTTYACRYQTVSFTKGTEHMLGERALIYVRSRHAEGDTGNDFSRGQRQQAVLIALKNKLLTTTNIADLTKLKLLSTTIQSIVKSDMLFYEALILARSAQTKYTTQTILLTQDEPDKGKKGLLVNPPLWQYAGAWVLTPKQGDFKQINKYVACVIESGKTCADLIN